MFTVTWTDGYRMDIDAVDEQHALEIARHLRTTPRHHPDTAERQATR